MSVKFGSFVGRKADPTAAQLTALAQAVKEKLSDERTMKGRAGIGSDELYPLIAGDPRVVAVASDPSEFEAFAPLALSQNP